jgi:pSer/pThr/pTyr-binding forkhead associated (FHA) protein
MAKLVILSEGMTGRTHELAAERTTIGRVEDNTFPIAEPSVSSHHCEVLLKGAEVRVRDLNSTNGTFIDGQQITEAILKPGQILRLGKIELRLETDASAQPKKPVEHTLVLPKGVSLNELEQGPRTTGIDTAGKGFSKKQNKTNRLFFIGVGLVMLVIIVVLVYVFFSQVKTQP